jgi:uncharacterized protein (DUF2141 family)
MKKTFIILTLTILTVAVSFAQTLTLEVRGFEKHSEKLYVGFYNSPKSFMKETFAGFAVDVVDSIMTMDIPTDNLPSGTYAISLYHDENGNNKLDTGIFGIPQEKFGFSNNATSFAGPPSFKQCKFEFKENKTLKIDLK